MSEQEYEDLWHYSERFTRDRLQRSELVTMAWKEAERLGCRSTPGLMKSFMHFRAKELQNRSAFPAHEMGKSTRDFWNRNDRVPSLEEFLLPMRITPLDFAIANDFMGALTAAEKVFLDDLSAGYSLKEIRKRQRIGDSMLDSLRKLIEKKAERYL